MTQDELIKLLEAHEWSNIEFKEARKEVPQNAYETVSAFANTSGGHLVFGVKKDGSNFEVVGILNVDKVQNDFLTTLCQKDKISLIIAVEEGLHNIDGSDILIFYIPEAARHEKPVHLNRDIKRSFIRKGGADVRCCQEELNRFLSDASKERYDGEPLVFDMSSCFDQHALSWYRKVYESKNEARSYADKGDIEFLHELGLIKETPQGLRPTRASIILFGTDASFRGVLPRPVADCQKYGTLFDQNLAGVRWDDRLVLDYNLIRSWQDILAWYQKLINTPFSVDPQTLQRQQNPPDYIAFREAIINLLIHQDYSDHGRKPEIKHYSDRTIFWNPGDAFNSADSLLEPGEKEVRNPAIVTAFRRIGLSENAGWGLREVFSNWQQLGNIPPIIDNSKQRKTFQLDLVKELLLSEEQIMFQAHLGVHLPPSAARLFAYICRQKEISLSEAKAVLEKSSQQTLDELQHLVTQALIEITVEGRRYKLADHLSLQYQSLVGDDPVRLGLSVSMTDHVHTSSVRVPMDLSINFIGETSTSTQQIPVGLVTPSSDKAQATSVGRLKLNDNQKKVILLCGVPQTATTIMAELGVKHRSFFNRNILAPLIAGGLIKRTHPAQPKHPKQAYILTESGLRLLDIMNNAKTIEPTKG